MTAAELHASPLSVSGLFKLALKRGVVAVFRFAWLVILAVFVYLTYDRPVRDSIQAADTPLDRKSKDVTRDVLRAAKPDHRTTADIARDLLHQGDERPATAYVTHVEESVTTQDGERVPKLSVDSQRTDARRGEGSASTGGIHRDDAGNSADEFLRQMREHTERREAALDKEVERLEQRERAEFKFFIVLASITVAFVVICAGLFIAGVIAAAVPSAVASLFTGACTTIVKWLSKHTELRRTAVARVREDNINTLQAIHAVQLVRDPQQRDAEVAKLAAWLRERAMKTGSRIDTNAA